MPKPKPGTGKPPRVIPARRYASGRAKPEADTGWAPTEIRRFKEFYLPKVRGERLGSQLGVLCIRGIISESECLAGLDYAELCGRWARANGGQRRSAASPAYQMGYRASGDVDLERLVLVDPEAADRARDKMNRRIADVKRKHDAIQATMPTFPILLATIVDAVCLDDQEIHSVHYPMLRNQLQRFIVHFLGKQRAAPVRKRAERQADAGQLALQAVTHLTLWMRKRDGTADSFKIEILPDGVRFTVFGSNSAGPLLHGTIVRARSLEPAEIEAALRKAATDRGLDEYTAQPIPETIDVATLEAAKAKLKEGKQE